MARTLFGSGVYRVLWAGLDGGSPIAAMLQFAVLAIPAGLFGALVAGVLMLLDLLVVGGLAQGPDSGLTRVKRAGRVAPR